MSRLERWRWRPWLGALGGVLALVVLLPPVGAEARRYVFAQAVQFAVLATAVPALVVLGAPWRLGVRATAGFGGAAKLAAGRAAGESGRVAMGLVDRVAAGRSHHRPGTARCLAVLIGFIALAVFWRLPLAVNALVTSPALTVVEALTLLAAGTALWLELVESPPFLPRIGRPLRAAFAAVPMWTIWATAYIMGFSHVTWFSALGHRSRSGLGVIGDQELAAVVLWAIPGLFFIPVVYFSLITWLRDTADPDDELREVPTAPGEVKPPSAAAAPRLAPSAPLINSHDMRGTLLSLEQQQSAPHAVCRADVFPGRNGIGGHRGGRDRLSLGRKQEAELFRQASQTGWSGRLAFAGAYRFWPDPAIMSSVTSPSELSLAELNELPESAARQALASCCAAASWIDVIVSGRGYSSVDRVAGAVRSSGRRADTGSARRGSGRASEDR